MLPALLVISCFAPAMFGPSRKAMLHTLPAEQHAQAGGVAGRLWRSRQESYADT
ncbi:MAG: hypothetical protein AAF563_07845 [Pseudomonadota bacterium]